MDQIQLKQKIAEYYVKLPDDLKVFFAEQSWITNIQQISLKYKLSTEQTNTLNTETTLLLLCIININEYAQTIEKELKLPTEILKQVLSDIGEKILKETYGSLEDGYLKNISVLEKENAVEMQDVPLPPYKKIITNDQLPITDEKGINSKIEEGIILNNEKILVDQTKKDVNFLAQKLNQTIVTPTTISDHSLPNLNKQSNPIIKSHDPYREGIEL